MSQSALWGDRFSPTQLFRLEEAIVAGDVERLESWQLPAYLRHVQQGGATAITWNKEEIPLPDAIRRAEQLSETATVVADGATIYVAEPDHSPDNPPRLSPLQIQPRRHS